MKTIGLIGGMSWQSTIVYYRIINEAAAGRLGGLHCARMALYNVDFAEIAELQRRDDWETAGAVLVRAAQALERAGAELLLIGANTMHIVAAAVHAVEETAPGYYVNLVTPGFLGHPETAFIPSLMDKLREYRIRVREIRYVDECGCGGHVTRVYR